MSFVQAINNNLISKLDGKGSPLILIRGHKMDYEDLFLWCDIAVNIYL